MSSLRTLDLAVGKVVDSGVVVGNTARVDRGLLRRYGHDEEGDKHQEDADGLGVVLGEDALAVEGHGLGPAGGLATRVGGWDRDALSGHCWWDGREVEGVEGVGSGGKENRSKEQKRKEKEKKRKAASRHLYKSSLFFFLCVQSNSTQPP